MKICLSLVHLITISFLLPQIAFAQAELPQARIVTLNVDPEQVVVLQGSGTCLEECRYNVYNRQQL
jgi:hypothetical protein